MQPELLTESTINAMLIGGGTVALFALIMSLVNLRESVRRIRSLGSMLDPQRIVSMGVVREGVVGIIVSVAALTFTGQAWVGDFQLTANWFSFLFMFCIYAGAIMRLILGLTGYRDRKLLDALRDEGIEPDNGKTKRRG